MNKRVVCTEQADGSLQPILKADRTVLRHKEYQETKHKVDATLAKINGGIRPVIKEAVK